MLLNAAGRISQNRTVAGVHFPVDSIAGSALGVQLGKYLVNRASGNAQLDDIDFNGEGLAASLFEPAQLQLNAGSDPMGIDVTALDGVSSHGAQPIPATNNFESDPMAWLWGQAVCASQAKASRLNKRDTRQTARTSVCVIPKRAVERGRDTLIEQVSV